MFFASALFPPANGMDFPLIPPKIRTIYFKIEYYIL
jgi:hypothetical protein